jgi:hypothetical protein
MTSSEFLAYPNLPLSDKRIVRSSRTLGKFGAFFSATETSAGDDIAAHTQLSDSA